ncbi:MAG: hypothetical protein F6J93_35430 [Oscillatoria sp. SIO1A7]|nr:hypothetical protein [Oscillatoria sp. SIO1A7]
MTIFAVTRGRSYWDATPVVPHINLRNAIGYTKEQLRHLDLRSISHPEDFAVEVRLIESLLEEGLKRQSLRKRYLRLGERQGT